MQSGTRVNVAIELALAIRHQSQLNKKGLFCGAYITRILKNMQIFPDPPPEDEVAESYPMSDVALRQWGVPKVQDEGDSSEEEEAREQTTTTPGLQELTQEVKKLKRKNKSLKRYIKSVAEAFARKFEVVLPDCLSSSSSGSDEDRTTRGVRSCLEKGQTSTAHPEPDDQTEKEIEDLQAEEEEQRAESSDEETDDGEEQEEEGDDDDDDEQDNDDDEEDD